jgi:hypothetical protein
VGADLFGGFQPVINAHKRLKVRYTFEGRESTVIRGENQMLVLPEDEFFKEEIKTWKMQHDSAIRSVNELFAQIQKMQQGGVSESDPLVYLEFVDARMDGSDRRELQAYFSVVNRSDSEARNIILEPIEMHGRIVQFARHRLAAPLLPKREVAFYPDVVTSDNKSVTDREKDLFHMFCLDYLDMGDSTICEAVKSVRATYQDSERNLFEVTCELVFDPSAHGAVRVGNRGSTPVIHTRNHKFRKVARALPLLEDKQSETGI